MNHPVANAPLGRFRFPSFLSISLSGVVLGSLVLTACGDSGDRAPAPPVLSVGDAWARPMAVPEESPPDTLGSGINSAVYLVLSNEGEMADSLVGGSTPVARLVELHETRTQEEVARMRPVEAIEVEAGGEAHLEPGGLHIMLIDLRRSLAEGDTIPLTLRFRTSGPLELQVPVRRGTGTG